jgi:hypothetical protein
LYKPYVVQEGGGVQYLRVVGGALGAREVYGQGVDPQAVGVPVDRVLPYPSDESFYLLLW